MSKLSTNDEELYNTLVHLNESVEEAQDYISKQYNVESQYDYDTATLKIIGNGNTLKTVAAKNYCEDNVDTSFIDVVME